ncbi:LOW QUALITY PROTEIN: coiled-coil domain-containing protein 40 [Drosophila tropicalis]|uniref:LOW QUALITY PROTEIN: coiled-coil domain-containing protein 40 n=1 Tax=Drosophila tropicalis TaxID=46794 RepID=UPI0035AC0B8C
MHAAEDFALCNFANNLDEQENPVPEPEQLAILSANHPLLLKFQNSLKKHLLRTKEKLENEISELKYQVKAKEYRREAQGLALYDMQQKMSFQDDQIREIYAEMEQHICKRQSEEIKVEEIKKECEEKIKLTKLQKASYQKGMFQLEDLQSLGSNIKKWAYDVEDDVKNAKRIVSRDAQLQKKLSESKRKSDLLFYRLDMEVKKRDDELQSIGEEEISMKEILNVLNMSIVDANTDLEALQNEHRRLTQAWSEVIVAIQLRDRIMAQVQNSIRSQMESRKLNNTGINAIKKQISKEMELNKKLESFKQRLADDTSSLKRDCQEEAEILLKLDKKLEKFPELLAGTEADLQIALREGLKFISEIRKLDLTLDKYHKKKVVTEETILKLAQEQLINNKASCYRLKLLNKSQENRRNIDLSLSKVQNQLGSAILDVEKLRTVLFGINRDNDDIVGHLNKSQKKSDALDANVKKIQIQIEIRLKRFEVLSNKIENLQKVLGETYGNPTELKIKQIEKSIHTRELQIREHQQFWIMLQNHFVNLSQKRGDQLNEIQVTRKQLSIIKQKSLKIDQELELSEKKTKELMLDIQKHTAKLELLNDKIYKTRKLYDHEETELEQVHTGLNERLKDTELDLLNLEGDITEIQSEIELHKDLVIENHRECLSWETKYKLIEETIRWSKAERSVGGDIGVMKNEIHRMNIRYNQLRRAQEKLVQDLEHCVIHREQIFVNATVKEHIGAKLNKKNYSSQMQVKINEVRNKLKVVQNEITHLAERRLIDDVNNIERMIYMLRRIQNDLKDVNEEDCSIQVQIEDGTLLKHANLEQIIRKQNRSKAYSRLNFRKSQQKLPRSEITIQLHTDKQNDVNFTMLEMVQTLVMDYPEKKSFFNKVLHVLKN